MLDAYRGQIIKTDWELPGEPVRSEDQTVIDAFFDQVSVPPGLAFWGISPSGNYLVFAGESNSVVVYRVSDY